MGFWDFLKKKAPVADRDDGNNTAKDREILKVTFTETIDGKTSTVTVENTKSDERPTDFEHLTKDGELPFGWIYRNKEFTDKIGNEYSYFLNLWLDSRSKSPKEQYSALKSFVIYLEDVSKLCKAKGECFDFWRKTIASDDYIVKRKSELEELAANVEELQRNFIKRNEELRDLDDRIIQMLKENPNILQSNFVKMFDPIIKHDVSEKLYFMDKSGNLERTKSGRSYILRYKE